MNDQTIGVAGLGLLGRGIAACCLAHGFPVIAFTRRQATHDTARRYIGVAVDDLVDKAGFPSSLRDEWMDRYTPVTSIDRFADCDMVIESVIEDLGVKRAIFDEIEAAVRADVPIASNTSSIPITRLQEGRKHPRRFVGMHWAEPSHATRFMELIRGEQTSDAVFESVAALARRFGKDPALVRKDVPAFIVNRIGYAMYREAVHILEMGVADVETIDRSCRNALGLWATMCGPFRWMDITGGPAAYGRAIAGVLPSLSNATELPDTFKEMIEKDAGGASDGHGFYEYTDEDRERWERLYREHAWTVRRLQDEYFPRESSRDGT